MSQSQSQSKLSKAERRARQESRRDKKEYQELKEYYYKPTDYTKEMSTITDSEKNFIKREAKFNVIDKEMEEHKFKNRTQKQMKDILKQLPIKSKTENIGNDDYEPRQKSGNHWLKFRNHPGLWYGWHYPIDVTEKCGIELLNYKDIPIHKYGMNTFPIFCNTTTLHRHLQENLGIKCSRKLDYKSMLKLLRNV